MSHYHEFQSVYQYGRRAGVLSGTSPTEFYNQMKTLLLKDETMRAVGGAKQRAAEYNRAATEQQWHECGCPYYKVDNAAVQLFQNVSLEVPYKYIKMPFPAFLIRLESDNQFVLPSGRRVQSLFVCQCIDEDNIRCMDLWADCGEKEARASGNEKHRLAVLNYLHSSARDDEIVSENLKRVSANAGDSDVSAAGYEEHLMRIAISVCFLATSSDKMIRPDVLSKDLDAYLEAERKHDPVRMKVIAERAVRRGKTGFLVDGRRELIHSHHEVGEGGGTGHSLQYRHMRSAHFRYIKKLDKVTFVRMHPVRPDLPSRPGV